MYITYRGFINEADAKKEHDTVMEHKEEYDNAKTVEAYMAERILNVQSHRKAANS